MHGIEPSLVRSIIPYLLTPTVTVCFYVWQYTCADHESKQVDDNDESCADTEGDEPSLGNLVFIQLYLNHGHLRTETVNQLNRAILSVLYGTFRGHFP